MADNPTLLVAAGTEDTESSSIPAKRAGPLANYNLRLLWLGESISLLGDQFYMVALPWLTLQLTGSAIAVGAIFAVAGIPRALFMLVGGVLTDRLSARLLMLVSNTARLGVTGLLTILVLTNSIQLWMLYVISLAFGIVDAFFHPAYMAMIPLIVEDEDLAASNAALQGTSLLVTAAGPGIGGVLVKVVGIGFSFLLDTLSFAAATLTLLFMKPVEKAKTATKQPTSMLADIREAMVYIWKDDVLRPFMLIVIALNFLFTGPLSVGPAVMARDRFVEGSIALGVLYSALGIGSLLGMLAGSALKPSRIGLVTLVAIGMSGVCLVGAGYSESLWLTALLFALTGASSGFGNLLMITWLQRRIAKEMLGRVMSIVMLSSVGLVPISTALGGFIAEYSLPLLFTLNGCLLVVTVAVSLLDRNVRSLRA